MKRLSGYTGMMLILVILLLLYSCKKGKTCEECVSINKPPVANAGDDKVFPVTSAADSFILNGMLSTDPDGSIVSYQWLRIFGPTSINVTNGNSGIATVKKIGSGRLESGIYHFVLIVKDNNGASARDSVLITVTGPPGGVDAGSDQVILFPGFTSFTLTGRADPNIYFPVLQFEWTVISAPSPVTFITPAAISTEVQINTAGVYLFRFQATNSAGISAADTVQITVNNDNLSGQEFIFNNLQWEYDHWGNGEVLIYTPDQPGLFYSSERPMQVSIQLDSSAQWLAVPGSAQPNTDFNYWIVSPRLFIYSSTNNLSLVGRIAKIKVRFI